MQRRVFLKKATLAAAAGGTVLSTGVFGQETPGVSPVETPASPATADTPAIAPTQTPLVEPPSAVLGAPVSSTITWRLASSFPRESDAIFAGAENLARYVSEATDGKFVIQVSPAGDIVPAMQVLDAVQSKTVECGHTASNYYFDKDPALCFDGGVPFGLNTRQMNAWMRQADGLALTRVLFNKYNIINFPCGYTGAQMGGWFRPEIKSIEDLRGLKIRAGGLSAQIWSRLGAVPQDVAAADIFTALEQGALDAAKWIGPYDDEKLALYKVAKNYYFPGWQSGTLQVSLYVNQDAYDALPQAYKSVLAQASAMASTEMIATYDAENPEALRRLVGQGAQLKAFPKAVLQACYDASLAVYQDLSAKDAMFKKVYDSMKAFQETQIPWFRIAESSYDSLIASVTQRKTPE